MAVRDLTDIPAWCYCSDKAARLYQVGACFEGLLSQAWFFIYRAGL